MSDAAARAPSTVPNGTILFETVYGSRAYGLATASSDTDLRGVFVPVPLTFLGYQNAAEQVEPGEERVLYEIRKFFRLAAACNPTVIEVLFTDPADHVTVSPEGARLLERRRDFLSRLAGDSFGRYGLAQLHRIRTHRRWLLTPPARKPEHPREWQQYQEWLRARNPKRAALEREYGYDTKHAMHLVRLLRMATEILATGEVHVRRHDADELRAIREGALSYEALLEQAEALGARIQELVETTALPARPDETRLNAFCAELVAATHRRMA